MDEARSLTYSVNVEADTAQAEANIRNLTSNLGSLQNGGSQIRVDAETSSAESGIRNVTSSLGDLQTQASSVGSAFRSSFLSSIDGGNTFASSLRSGIGGALSYVGERANTFRDNIVQTTQSIGHGFAHPIETIRGSLGNALQSARERFIDMARSAQQASDATEGVGDAAGNARRNVTELGGAASDAEGDVADMGNAADESGGKFEKLGSILKGVGGKSS